MILPNNRREILQNKDFLEKHTLHFEKWLSGLSVYLFNIFFWNISILSSGSSSSSSFLGNIFYRHSGKLLFRNHDFECDWSWYVVTKLNSCSFLLISGTLALIIPSTKVISSWILFLLKTNPFRIHRREWICGLPRTWNSTIIAH